MAMSSFPSPDPVSSGIGLLAGIAHDLRTPLARLRLRAELECPEEVSRAMEADFLAVTHLIDQILGYAQGCVAPMSGGQGSLHEVLRHVVATYRQAQAEVGLGPLAGRDLVVPWLSAQRALGNLIDNALSHGLAPVQVEVQPAEGGVDLLVFDQGPGLAAGQLVQAVQPFVRLSGLKAPDRAGSPGGLGLAIVAQLSRQLGGHLVLRTFDGHRSGIGIHLPIPE